jgi:hypothetical protein
MKTVHLIRVAVVVAALVSVPTSTLGQQVQNRFVGVFTMSRTGAGGTETLTLALKRDKSCTLKTGYQNDRSKEVLEKGTWRADGETAILNLTQSGSSPEKIEITFELQGEMLVAVKYDKSLYGSEGLRFKRQRH